MTFPNPLNADDPLDAATLNPIFNALYYGETGGNALYTAAFYPDEFVILNGNAVAITFHSGEVQTYGQQNPSALNDEWQHGAFLSPDTYTLTLRAIRSSSSGILKIKINDVVVATFDLYAASDGAVAPQQTGIVIGSGGWKVVKGLVDSKNASSSGYDANVIKMFIKGASV